MGYRQNMGVGSASAVAGAVRRLGSRRINMYFTPDITLNLTTNIAATRTVTAGTSTAFTIVAAGGTTPYTYKWYYRAAKNLGVTQISGATAATYTIASPVVANSGFYVCEITDARGQVIYSVEQHLTVNSAPAP